MAATNPPAWLRIPKAVAAIASLDAAPWGLLWVDPEGLIGFANRYIETQLAWNPAELAGQPISRIAGFWSGTDWQSGVWPKLAGGASFRVQNSWNRKGGGTRSLDASLARLQVAGQDFAAIHLQDPQELRSGAHGPESSLEFLDGLRTPVAVLNADLTIERVNPNMCSLIGQDVSGLIGRSLPELLAPVEGDQNRWSQVSESGLQDWGFKFRNRHGEVIHLVVSTHRFGSIDAGQARWLVVAENVTERVQLQGLLEQREHSFEHLAANMPGMIYRFVLTREGHASFPYASPGARDIWEIDPASVVNDAAPIVRLIHPEDLPRFQESVMQSAAQLCPWEFEGRMTTPSGKLKWWHAASRPELAENGSIVWQGLLMDITHQKQIEDELKQAKLKAESAARAKADFLANMSHEIRTPMNGVIGMAELLMRSELSARQRHYVDTIRGSAEVLLTIINDILDISKMEAGKLTLHLATFDLRRTLEDVAALLAPRAFEKGLEVILRYDPRAPSRVLGDAVRIRQILTNLIGNAIKFTAQGHVLIQVELKDRETTDATLRFSVHDTGIGISPDALKRIFQKFEQADTSTSRKFGGTGLGLAISQQLVELMGGRMEVQSELDRGSTFHFTLTVPIRDAEPGTEIIAVDLSKLHVLTVDDHPVNREMLRDILGAWGVPHAEADSGMAALKMLREAATTGRRFDVVLLDYQMPGMDGLFLASAIRAEPALSDLVLIMLSSSSFTDDQQRKLAENGITAHLLKPLRQFELRQALINAVEESLTEFAHRSGESIRPGPARTLEPAPAPAEFQEDDAAGLRVLLAEDNEVNREIAIDMLKTLGCDVEWVANGVEAVTRAHEGSFDLIFMDCQMPEMDGFEASRRIRELELAPQPVIIAMTAYAMAGDRERCLAAGMDDYLAKPVTFAELKRVTLKQAKRFQQQLSGDSPVAVSGPAAANPTISADAQVSGVGKPPPLSGVASSSSGSIARMGSPSFDPAAGLAVTGGKTEILRKAVAIWWTKVPHWLTDLKTGIQRGDHHLIRRTAHTMRGAAGNIGAVTIARRAAEIELGCGESLNPKVPDLFDQLVLDIDRLQQVTAEVDWENLSSIRTTR